MTGNNSFLEPFCSVYSFQACPCGQNVQPIQSVKKFKRRNGLGALHPNWKVIDNLGRQGYFYENTKGNCFFKEGNGASHHNLRDGRFVCHTPNGIRIETIVERYTHPVIYVGPFRVQNGTRVYNEVGGQQAQVKPEKQGPNVTPSI